MEGAVTVIDWKRRARLYPEVKPWFEVNMMNICLVIMFMTFIGLWVRAVDIRKKRNVNLRSEGEPTASSLPGS